MQPMNHLNMLEAISRHFQTYSLLYASAALPTILLCLTIHFLYLRPFLFSPLRSVPGPPLGHPIFGQFLTISSSGYPTTFREWVKKYGPVMRVIGPIGMERLVFMKPEVLHQILVSDWFDFPRPTHLHNLFTILAGAGLFTTTGNEHRLMRKAMNPAFSITHLMAQTEMYYGPINKLIDILGDEVDNSNSGEKVVQLYEWLSKVLLDILCQTAFGYGDSLGNPNDELAAAYSKIKKILTSSNSGTSEFLGNPIIMRVCTSQWVYEHRHWFEKIGILADLSTLIEFAHTVRAISARMLNEKIREAEFADSEESGKHDIMSILIRARIADLKNDKSVYTLSDEAMRDQILTFLGAGHETTCSALCWTLWLLANDQECQKKLRAEVTPIFASCPNPDYRTLKDMQWLDCVVMESLRVLPPVPGVTRIAQKTGYIGDVLVPAGTRVYVPIFTINTCKEMWGEDAEEFRPSRWLDLPKTYNPIFSFSTFIVGPHTCIGKSMAVIETKAIVASLIAHFEIEPAYKGQTIKPESAFTMRPDDGLPLKLKRVTPANDIS